jgi:hypothetical protein
MLNEMLLSFCSSLISFNYSESLYVEAGVVTGDICLPYG